MGLRAVGLAYPDPFTHRVTAIRGPVAEFFEIFWVRAGRLSPSFSVITGAGRS